MPRSISPAVSTTPSSTPTAHELADEGSSHAASSPSRTRTARTLAFLRETLPTRSLTGPLLVVTVACGLLDATTYADFGIFASNQTGNALVLTLLLTSTPLPKSNSPHLVPTAVSLLAFLLCGFVFGQLGHLFGPRKRGWWLFSFVFQSACLLAPAMLMSTDTLRVGENGSIGQTSVLIGLLAAGAGAQVALARTSSNPEIPTAMLTSPFIDLLTDLNFFAPPPLPRPFVSSHPFAHPRSRPRNVRILYVFALIGGCFLGAGIHKGGGTETVMWVSVGLRLAVMVWVAVLGGEEEEKPMDKCVEKEVTGCQAEKCFQVRRLSEMREESRREVEPRSGPGDCQASRA